MASIIHDQVIWSIVESDVISDSTVELILRFALIKPGDGAFKMNCPPSKAISCSICDELD